ncbi:methyl-accepting chemotaxis protein [Oligoflexus tunisiensis]|uniref:methyl-accepting chemotaxis protein n=1 Tax=Oligoflexus tunisiensis TaxID=708132 RepID=UPI00114D067D|nr:methyl-accepting chemotaxis protein [Oligoflexus tunisiensis]
MSAHNRILALILWLGSLLACLWVANLMIWNVGAHNRNDELQRIQNSWEEFGFTFPKDSNEARVIAASAQNLNVTREGSLLLERNALAIMGLLSLIVLGLASLALLSGSNLPLIARRRRERDKLPIDDAESMSFYLQTLEQTVADLKLVCQDLGDLDNDKEKHGQRRNALIDSQFDQLVRVEAQLQRIRSDVLTTISSSKDITDKLQRLATQCEDSSHFASATRLEWNVMGSKLRQIKESHDKVKNTADKISKQHTVTNELLIKTLDFGNIHSKHTETSREQVSRLAEISRETLSTMDILASSMAQSNQDVNHASKLVRGLSERAEEIVNTIDVIDDIAEQTNQLALNASIEAARAGEQGQGFAVVAGEVRNLAARSSTATKSITDLLGTIQQEADHASHCLEKSARSVELAHSRMLEVDRSYREAVTLSRQALSELSQLVVDVGNHMHDLKQIEKQSAELRKFCVGLNNLLEDHGRMTSVTYTEANQLTIHSDRLARLLNRQFFEMSHCDRLVEGLFYSLESIKGRIEEGIANSENLLNGFNQVYQQSLQQDVGNSRRSARFGRMIELVKSCSRSLEIIRSPSEQARTELAELYRVAEAERTLQPSPVLSKQTSPKEERDETDINMLPEDDVLIGEPDETQKVS